MKKITLKSPNYKIWLGFIAIVFIILFSLLFFTKQMIKNDTKQIEISIEVDRSHYISEEPITYTAFIPVNNEDQDYANNPVWIKLQEMTNIHFEFISPINGDEAEEVLKNLLASGKYPDIVMNSTAGYPGGFEKAINDGIYIDILPYIQTYAPNYYDILEKYSQELSGVYTEDHLLPGFWEIYDPEDSIPIIGGMTIREDFLYQTGLSVPQTIDEWTELLRALKKIDSIEYPLIFGQQNGVNVTAEFLSAFGIGAAPVSVMNPAHQLFYPKDGTIRYGAIENGYKEYLLLMNQWYTEGLLDKDFGVRRFTDVFERGAIISKGKSAVNWQYAEWMLAYKDLQGNQIDMVATPMPKLSNTDQNVPWMFSRKPYTGNVLSITSKCENIIPLLKFFDFLYSEEGILLQNYGIEGDTYTLENDQPVFTSKIMNYKKGPFEGIGKFVNNNSAVMYNLSYTRAFQSQLYGEKVLEMKETWLNSADLFSMDLQLSVDENTRLVKIMNSITNYVTEYTIKAIVDRKVADNWEENIEVIKNMGIDEALEIMQSAYDRQGGSFDEKPAKE